MLQGVKYNQFMSNKKAPFEIGVSGGASLITAEATMNTDSFIIRLSAVKPQQEISHDLPQLQNRSGEGRKGPQPNSTVQMPEVRQTGSLSRKNDRLEPMSDSRKKR
jgi:hypothetical protein